MPENLSRFFNTEAGFTLIQSLITLPARATYGDIFIASLLNTVVCAAAALPVSLLIAGAVCALQLSTDRLAAGLARAYVNIFRNVPLLLWLLIFYRLLSVVLPEPAQSLSPGFDIYLNRRGLYLPWFGNNPVLGNFNIEGGICLLPEYLALTTALAAYTGAFMAENLRGAVLSVPIGLREAAAASGLSKRAIRRYITGPAALRIAKPALIGQSMNLVKNSSLAAAVGYPDVMQVMAGTALSRTGQAGIIMGLVAVTYLLLNLPAALIGYGKREEYA